MKAKFLLIGLATFALVGCTSTALRRNAANQSKTVGEFLTDQVLYNLAVYERYYREQGVKGVHPAFNVLPSFIRLQTGQAQVQQSVSGQFALKFPLKGGDEIDPQVTGTHQTQDNWTFVPVTDPGEIKRLYYLYSVLFKKYKPDEETNISQTIFPEPPPALDQQGRPFLRYEAQLVPKTTNNEVKLESNQPVFKAYLPIHTNHPLSDVPGALITERKTTNGWFSFTRPPAGIASFYAGTYLGTNIWITNADNFVRFTLLSLGPTNNLAFALPSYSVQNGLLIPR